MSPAVNCVALILSLFNFDLLGHIWTATFCETIAQYNHITIGFH